MAPSRNIVNCVLCGLPTQHFCVCFFKVTCVLSSEVGHIYSYVIFIFSSNKDEGPWGGERDPGWWLPSSVAHGRHPEP